MPMNKIQDVKLETTATYQPLSDLNVRFWNQDKNTAELRFIITRNQSPLSLSKENVKVIIALESGASFISSDDFIIDSEVEGIARYVIPNDFMRVANNVKGQVYVTTLDGEEVIVERQFKFTVSNDLLSDYPSEDKLRYIKTFDDLRTEISSRVSKLESDMETMEDYVTKVQDTTQEGITALSTLIQQKQDAYNANHTAKLKELNDKGTEYSTKFDADKQYIDEKTEAFKESVTGSGLVTTGESKDWQKYKLTNDDGSRVWISGLDPLTAKSGFYETTNMVNAPLNNNTGFFYVDIISSSNGRRLIVATYSIGNRMFIKTVHNDGEDNDWKELVSATDMSQIETTTGSQAKANTAESNAKTYANELVGKKTTLLFEGTANGVGTTINLSETLDNFVALIIFVSFPGGLVTVLGNPYGTNTIPLQLANIIDAGGDGGGIYEAILTKNTRTQLSITNDVYFDVGALKGSDANANKITIKRIVGVRK